MLKAFRVMNTKAISELEKWVHSKHQSVVSQVAVMEADDGSAIVLLQFNEAFVPASIPGFGIDVKPIPLPDFNIEIKDIGELEDIIGEGYNGSIGAEYIRDFLYDIARSGRPAIVKTSQDGIRYLMLLDKEHENKLKYLAIS
jgi:hypothetical protein